MYHNKYNLPRSCRSFQASVPFFARASGCCPELSRHSSCCSLQPSVVNKVCIRKAKQCKEQDLYLYEKWRFPWSFLEPLQCSKITTSCQLDMTSPAGAVYILQEYCNPINTPTDAPYLEHPLNRDVDLNELLVQTNSSFQMRRKHIRYRQAREFVSRFDSFPTETAKIAAQAAVNRRGLPRIYCLPSLSAT